MQASDKRKIEFDQRLEQSKTLLDNSRIVEAEKNTEKIFIGSADYIGYRLTGVSQTDTTTAATTGLMQLYSRIWL